MGPVADSAGLQRSSSGSGRAPGGTAAGPREILARLGAPVLVRQQTLRALARRAPRPRRHYIAFAVAAALVLLLQFARSMSRDFDLDEHQFVAPPALLVRQGVLPYRDYPYFHMPTLIYLYAALTGWAPYKLLAARVISALCGTATVLLLLVTGWRLLAGLRDRPRALLSGGIALTFACSRLFTYTSGWAWNHDAAVLCALLACLLHLRGLRRAAGGPFVAAGFLVGLAIGIRLSFALVIIPFAVSLLCSRSALSWRRRGAALGGAMLAAVLALLPALGHLAASRDQFVFGNLGYARLNTIFYAHLDGPGPISLPARLGHGLTTFLGDPGNAALLLLVGLALVALVRRGRQWRPRYRSALGLLLGLQPALWAGALGPAPSQYQYFYMVVPFLALVVLYALAAERFDPSAMRHWRRLVLAGAIIAGATGLPRWYWGVIHLAAPERWTPVQVHRLGEWVAAHVPPDGPVLTIDPLVPLEGRVAVYPEFAVGRFVMHVGRYMSACERHRYQMAWGAELDQLLAQRPPAAVLTSRRLGLLTGEVERYAAEHGFVTQDSPDGEYRLWTPPECHAEGVGRGSDHAGR
jgi:hypothetical protein